MADVADVRASLAQFWGIGPSSNEQLAGIADELRSLEPHQIRLLKAYIPRGVPGTDIGGRCDRLRDLIQGVLAEDPADTKAQLAGMAPPPPPPPLKPPEPPKARAKPVQDQKLVEHDKITPPPVRKSKGSGRFGRKH
jgi:hypothetical protein